MVTEVAMTVWMQRVQGGKKVKDQDVDEAHGKNEGVDYDKSRQEVVRSLQNLYLEKVA